MRKQTLTSFYILMCMVLSFYAAQSQLPNLIPYRKADKWGFANNQKKIVIEPVYDSVAPFSEGRAAVMKAKKWGFVDETGKEIVPHKYDRAMNFRNKKAIVTIAKYSSSVWGCIDWSGKEIVPPQFDLVAVLDNGFIRVKIKSLNGLFNEKGEEILKPSYSSIYEFKNGVAKVELNKQWGFIDSTGKAIVPPKSNYINAFDFSDGLGIIEEKESTYSSTVFFFYVNVKGEVVNSKEKYVFAQPYVKGLAKATIKHANGQYETKIMDMSGNSIIVNKQGFGFASVLPNAIIVTKAIYPDGYESGRNAMEDFTKAIYKYGVIDRKGNILKEAVYEKIEHLHGDWLALLQNGKWDVYNSNTNKIIAQGLDNVRMDNFARGIKVQKNSKQGYIDLNGKQWVTPKYDSIGYENNGLLAVGNGGKFGYADINGKEVVPLKYQMTFEMEQGIGFFAMNDKAGIVNSKGKEVIPAKYDLRKIRISSYGSEMLGGYAFKNGIALVKINGKSGYVDNAGNEYWEDM